MAYSISDVVSSMKAMMPWMSTPVAGDPLNGLVDGVNKRFRTSSAPIEEPVTVTDSAGAPVAVHSVDYLVGLVTLVSAPTAPCYASYVHVLAVDATLAAYAVQGFRHMEIMLPRGYHLVQVGTERYVSADSATVVDPPIGDSTFSARPAQTTFLDLCALLAFLESRHIEAAMNAMTLREERIGGLMIDRGRQPAAFEALIGRTRERVRQACEAAANDAGLSYALYEGGIVPGARSDYYTDAMDWWRMSRQRSGMERL